MVLESVILGAIVGVVVGLLTAWAFLLWAFKGAMK